jgi:DNA-binding transcriptional regulator WhiA
MKNKDFAEFLGIMSGDGYLLIKRGKRKLYRIQFTLNKSEDMYYFDHISELSIKLFGIKPKKQMKKENAYHINIHNKKTVLFVESQGFPSGKKKNKLTIPKWILENKKYTRAFLKGLMETDGSLFFAKRGMYKINKYPVMEIKCSDERFMKQVHKAFKTIGFEALFRRCKQPGFDDAYKIQLNGEKWLNKWIKEIGFNNLNYKTRYIVWMIIGYCPPKTNLKSRLDIIRRVGRSAYALDFRT